MQYITCKFSCEKCGITDVKVQVRVRRKGECLSKWFELLAREVQFKHTMLSFLCDHDKITALKIPFDKNGQDAGIGEYTANIPPDGDLTKEV